MTQTSRAPAAVSLLGPDDPPPFERINADAGGRLLLVCDHAAKAIPASLEGLGLEPLELERHIGWDIGAGEVARLLSERLGAPAVLTTYSRLVIDCNRDLDHPELIRAESDGTPVPGNVALSEADREARIDAIWRPYHAAVEAELARLREVCAPGETPAMLSIHSFTPVMDAFERPWQIGILWNEDSRIPEPLLARLRAEPDLTVGDNEPYTAREGYGDTIERHAGRTGIANALIEIRQDLIDTRQGAETWADRLAAILREVLADEAIYRGAPSREEAGR